ncbi:DUF5693 family protein [Virgibacillus sp. DJP39]|uniref:DUF5693 family protein n=1 Tax=Virgibacillus sp. DJP39 TaxID=3409790 RepID=UPI003BB4BA80
MNKRLWLWGITILLLLISLPGLYDRFQSVSENDTYELVAPYSEILELTDSEEDDALTLDSALTRLEEAGLTTVSVSPISLDSLEDQDAIQIFPQDELEETLMFSETKYDFPEDTDHLYFTIPEDRYLQTFIEENLNPQKVTIGDKKIFVIPTEDGKEVNANIGYNKEAINTVKKHGLNYILRVDNAETEEKEVINANTVEQVIQMQGDDFSNILFSGQDVIGYPDLEQVKKFATQINEADFNFYTIEFTRQRGLELFARTTSFDDVIRLHSMKITGEHEKNVDRAVRAVKERNIRSVFFHMPTKADVPMDDFTSTLSFIKDVQAEMPDSFKVGTPLPFETIDSPLWAKIAVLLTSVSFIYLAASNIFKPRVGLLASAFTILVLLVYALTQRLLFLQGLALMVAVITPIYAVLANSREGSNKFREIAIKYIKALGISFTGIIIVLGILNTTAFVTGFELFRGVKLVYIVPILFILLYSFWGKYIVILNTQVKYWHLLVITIIGLAGFYYVIRSGNTGTVSDLEKSIRYGLEELLYVRPRTKEFLIGFPVFVLALYVMYSHKIWGKILLVPGVIGFLSIVNTFTHFHIPMSISLLRTFYSIVFGFIIGILFIYLYRLGLYLFAMGRNKGWF